MKAKITLTHDCTAWILRNVKREHPTRYSRAKTAEERNALVEEYAKSVLLEHRASWNELEREGNS